MSDLFGVLLPLALGAAISPTMLAAIVLVLSGRHGRARAVVFTIGNVLVLTAVGIGGLILFQRATEHASSGNTSAASAAIDVVLGAVLIVLAARMVLRHHDDNVKHPGGGDDQLHLRRYFIFGVGMMVVNVSTLVLFIAATKEIAVAHVSDADRAVALAFLVVVASVTAWLPTLLTFLAPQASQRVLGKIGDYAKRHGRQVGGVIVAAIGVYLIVKGIGEWPG